MAHRAPFIRDLAVRVPDPTLTNRETSYDTRINVSFLFYYYFGIEILRTILYSFFATANKFVYSQISPSGTQERDCWSDEIFNAVKHIFSSDRMRRVVNYWKRVNRRESVFIRSRNIFVLCLHFTSIIDVCRI